MSRTEMPADVGGRSIAFPAWRRSGSTRCWPSAASSRRAAAPRRPCWPARCASGPSAAGALKPGQLVPPDVAVEVAGRAGVRLARRPASSRTRSTRPALDVAGRRCLDVGASTGGFTDCLLQRGAAHVVALDVAYGELDWRLRDDPRVTVIERDATRVRSTPAALPYAPDLIVVDVSFISLAKVLPAVLACAAERFDCLALVKPQFEVGRERVGKGGVVRDAGDRRAALVAAARGRARAGRVGARASPPRACPGPKGNLETFVWLAEAGARRRGGRRGRGPKGRAMTPPRRADRPHAPPARRTRAARCARCVEAAASAGVELHARRRGGREARAAATGSGVVARRARAPSRRPLHRARRRRHDPRGAARATPGTGGAGLRRQLRRGRLPRDDRAGRGRDGLRRALRRRLRGARAAGDRGRRRGDGPHGRRSTTSRSTAARAGASPTSRYARRRRGDRARALRRARRRHARPARPATTSPTAGRCWPGAWRASSSRSSRRTR